MLQRMYLCKIEKYQKVKESTNGSSNKRRKTLYRGYLHCAANFFATVLNIFSKEIISNNTKCPKHIFEVHIKHLKLLVK